MNDVNMQSINLLSTKQLIQTIEMANCFAHQFKAEVSGLCKDDPLRIQAEQIEEDIAKARHIELWLNENQAALFESIRNQTSRLHAAINSRKTELAESPHQLQG
ncbi:TPA: hypothetical protein ACGUOU_000651 [Vibrio vulnificus]|nr:hypothetical protein [Vibrio vulnificus]